MAMVNYWDCSRSILSYYGKGKLLGLLKVNSDNGSVGSAQGQCCLKVTIVNCWVCSRSMLS